MFQSLATGLGGLLLAQAFLFQPALAEMPEGDPAAGRKKAGMCRTCHGLDGVAKIPIAPNIGGESAGYIARQLVAFREGERTHEMMSVVTKGLDDQAIADLAAWFSSHKASAELPASVSSGAAPEACSACHGVAGLAEMEEAPHLAGETNIYIDTQLKAFRNGKRKHEIMSAIAADLTDEEIRAYADWYGASKLTVTPAE